MGYLSKGIRIPILEMKEDGFIQVSGRDGDLYQLKTSEVELNFDRLTDDRFHFGMGLIAPYQHQIDHLEGHFFFTQDLVAPLIWKLSFFGKLALKEKSSVGIDNFLTWYFTPHKVGARPFLGAGYRLSLMEKPDLLSEIGARFYGQEISFSIGVLASMIKQTQSALFILFSTETDL